jgi:hypothetical protein
MHKAAVRTECGSWLTETADSCALGPGAIGISMCRGCCGLGALSCVLQQNQLFRWELLHGLHHGHFVQYRFLNQFAVDDDGLYSGGISNFFQRIRA